MVERSPENLAEWFPRVYRSVVSSIVDIDSLIMINRRNFNIYILKSLKLKFLSPDKSLENSIKQPSAQGLCNFILWHVLG